MKTYETRRREKKVLALFVVLALTPVTIAQTRANELGHQRQIVVSIPDRKLAVIEDGKTLRVFAVAVGAAVSPSPAGEFRIVKRLSNPTYYHTGVVIPPGPRNPIGSRWIGLDRKGYGIHGTNAPESVGRAVSHGCIRLRNRDVEEFFAMVRVGDLVRIAGERDVQVAQIFDPVAIDDTVAEVQSADEAPSDDGQ
jgi:lipoprotein-anchoring transpeptidase ErfK/SrfK